MIYGSKAQRIIPVVQFKHDKYFDKIFTVKSFNFKGTEFRGLMTMDMFMDT